MEMELDDPHPSSSISATPSSPVALTIATPSIQTLTLALPIQQPRGNSNSVGGVSGFGGGREDCWSEGATSVLIDAWGERYLELSRGNLRQKHWQDVADAVTSRDSYSKNPKTDAQCKNRIDTLKKKYKVEKSKASSRWPFFHRLDILLGPAYNANPNPSSRAPRSTPPSQRTSQRMLTKRARSPPSISSEESSDGFPPEPLVNGKKMKETGPVQENKKMEGICAVTRAIVKLGKLYERIETSRLQHEMELEKHRMELARELEMQRIEFLMKM